MGRLEQPHPIHIGQPLLPILEAHIRPSWATILVHVGYPTSSILGTHTYPHWASNFVHIGSPSTSTLGNHVYSCWVPTPVHNRHPNLPKLEAQLRPYWAATFVHVGSPHLPTMEAQTHPSWKPNLCEWTPKMPPKSDAQSLCVDVRSCRRLEAHPKRWTPIVARGHATLPELRMPTSRIVKAHFLRWPRDLYATGRP